MKALVEIAGAIALVCGIAALFKALVTPDEYSMANASAIQISRVYAEATYYAVIAVAAFVLAGILLQATNGQNFK